MADNRDYQILGIWAENATTTIPADPVSGTVYRDETVDATEFAQGWPYDEIVDSKDFNQIMFLITSQLLELDQQGILGWNDTIDYGTAAVVRGSDDIFYVSTTPNGPSTTVVDPVGDVSGTWEPFTSSASSGGGAGFDIDLLTDGTGITIAANDRMALSDQDDSQTDKYVTISQIQTYMQNNLSFGGGFDIDNLPDGTGVTLAATDRFAFSDQDDSQNDKYGTLAQLAAYIFDIDALTDGTGITIAVNDRMAVSDQDDSATDKYVTVQQVIDVVEANISVTPPTTYQAIGTYAFAVNSGPAASPGTTVSGGNLNAAGTNASMITQLGAAFPGTWRVMGYFNAVGYASVVVRIS